MGPEVFEGLGYEKAFTAGESEYSL